MECIQFVHFIFAKGNNEKEEEEKKRNSATEIRAYDCVKKWNDREQRKE